MPNDIPHLFKERAKDIVKQFIEKVSEDSLSVPEEVILYADLKLEDNIVEKQGFGWVDYSLKTLPRPSNIIHHYIRPEYSSSNIRILDKFKEQILGDPSYESSMVEIFQPLAESLLEHKEEYDQNIIMPQFNSANHHEQEGSQYVNDLLRFAGKVMDFQGGVEFSEEAFEAAYNQFINLEESNQSYIVLIPIHGFYSPTKEFTLDFNDISLSMDTIANVSNIEISRISEGEYSAMQTKDAIILPFRVDSGFNLNNLRHVPQPMNRLEAIYKMKFVLNRMLVDSDLYLED